MTSGGVAASFRLLLALTGAFVSVVAISAGNWPGPLSARLQGTSVAAVIVFVVLAVGGFWVLRTASASAWRWAVGIGVVLATAQLAGLVLRKLDGAIELLQGPDTLAWVVAHWLGVAWLSSCGLAAVIQALDAHDLRLAPDAFSGRDKSSRPIARLVAALRGPAAAPRRLALLLVLSVLVLSRLPYLAVYWPGILAGDTFRAYSYARGTVPWDTYDPVGHSLLIAVMQWLGPALGWGDAGAVAIGSATLILTSSAALTFLLARTAVWGLHPGLWAAGFAWVVLLPIFGYFSIFLIKDVPFAIAMVVFLVCVGEVSLGRENAARKWWPWVVMTIAAIFVVTMRNNGIHVMALTLPLLLIPLRHRWKRVLVVSAALAAAYAIYVGPVYAALDVRPGPQEESYSVPLQQLGRITKYHWAELSPADQAFVSDVFAGKPPEELGNAYVPYLADPMKLSARPAWGERSSSEFLAGWSRIALQFPGTALAATAANTVGYWDPEGPSYDGLVRWSSNDRREIHLDIPSGPPTTGIAGAIESSGILPTKTYRHGLVDNGYRAIPVLGLAMSPGPVCWLWYIAALLVLRRRSLRALAVFVPAGVLLLTFLAGPVSGGQRYALTLFLALPLAIAAVALAKRPSAEPPNSEQDAVEEKSTVAGESSVETDRVPADLAEEDVITFPLKTAVGAEPINGRQPSPNGESATQTVSLK